MKQYSKHDIELLQPLNAIIDTCSKLGAHKDVKHYCTRIISIYELGIQNNQLDANHFNIGIWYHNIGITNMGLKLLDACHRNFEQALQYKNDKSNSENDHSILLTMRARSLLLMICGKTEQSKTNWQQCIEKAESIFGNNYIEIADFLILYGICCINSSSNSNSKSKSKSNDTEYFDAELSFNRSIDIYKLHFGMKHSIIADILVKLGDVLSMNGNNQYQMSENYYNEAIEIYKFNVHSSTANANSNLNEKDSKSSTSSLTLNGLSSEERAFIERMQHEMKLIKSKLDKMKTRQNESNKQEQRDRNATKHARVESVSTSTVSGLDMKLIRHMQKRSGM
jgi:tetratricopeptide (TPR) repeat protein